MTIFDAVKGQRGFAYDSGLSEDIGGQARGSLGGKDALLAINPTARSHGIERIVVAHELTHLAAGSGRYLDSELAQAAYEVAKDLKVQGLSGPPKFTGDNAEDEYSNYYNMRLLDFCH